MTFQEFLKIANDIVADDEFYKPNGIVDSENTRRIYSLWKLSEVTPESITPYSIESKVKQVLFQVGYI